VIVVTRQHHERWPNLLSTPETLGDWTDGRISCRHFSC